MTHVSICKNVIQSNNKKNWTNPEPAIRCSTTKAGKVVLRSNHIGIVDKEGNVVAEIISTTNGKPVIKCGAKVGLITKYDVVDLEH
jgi:predicted transcriptional regulator